MSAWLAQHLAALRDALRARGQDLLVLHGAPELLLPELAAQHRIARIGVASSVGVDEQRQLERVRGRVGIPLELHPANTLFRQEQLAFVPGEMPRQFTPFRERVEALDVDAVQPVPDALPPPPRGARFAALPRALASPHPGFTARGGKCLVALAERDGHAVWLVLLAAPERWWTAHAMIERAFREAPRS